MKIVVMSQVVFIASTILQQSTQNLAQKFKIVSGGLRGGDYLLQNFVLLKIIP